MKELIREKRIKHLHLRVFKDVISDEFEIVLTTSEYGMMKKTETSLEENLLSWVGVYLDLFQIQIKAFGISTEVIMLSEKSMKTESSMVLKIQKTLDCL